MRTCFRISTDHESPLHPRRGAIIIFLVIGVVMLLAMAMITVDVASMQLARTELRAASDAAAKAGAEALLRTQNVSVAKDAAINMGQLNKVAGKRMALEAKDVVVGSSIIQQDGSWTFTAGGEKPNAVRVIAMLSAGSASGPVNLVFGKIFDSGTFEPAKTSTASILQQEVCLAIDRSASMAFDLSGVEWSYPPGGAYEQPPHATLSRWASLIHAVDAYLTISDQTAIPPRVALVTWASDMNSDPLAAMWGMFYNLVDLEEPLTFLRTNLGPDLADRGTRPLLGGTNMSAGIDKGIQVLSASTVLPYAKRVIILMTDGQWNQGRSPLLAAADARARGIIIHVITFLPGAVSTDMTQVAELTGGRYIHADTEEELVAAFEELARTLPVVLTD